MKLNKPKFWDTKLSLFTILLIPFSLIVILIIYLKRKFTRTIKFNIPIICVGNIYIGGTGKTPASIFIANELSKLGKNPVILRKFYKKHVDEHNLIKKNFKNLILKKSRVLGIKESVEMNYDTVILDDGFQEYKIKKNLNIICFNQKQLIGNGLVLPSGPLREGLNSLKHANIILINGIKDKTFENKILDINKNLKIFYTNYRPINIEKFKNKGFIALAGIGNPNNFFDLLAEHKINIIKKLIYPDHYKFTKKEISKIVDDANKKNAGVIITEKDYYKIKEFNLNNIEYLKVILKIENNEKFIQLISKIYD
jgi:tetraacyldisaccharide 4'-kinase